VPGRELPPGAVSFGAGFWLGLLERLSSVPLEDKTNDGDLRKDHPDRPRD